MTGNVITIRPSQIEQAVMLCILAQNHMPKGKKFGALVWGQSGTGKNAFTDKLAEKFTAMTGTEWGLLDLNMAGMMPEDMTGLPATEDCKGGKKAVYLPLIKTGKQKMGICRMDEIDRPTNKATLIAGVKFAIDGTSENPLPENWFVLGMGNGISDSDTCSLTEHIVGRFCHLYVSTNSDGAKNDYNNYLDSRKANSAVKKLVRLNPMKTRDEFEEHAVYNNRTIEFADCIITAYQNALEQKLDFSDVLLPVLAGVIGRIPATELVTIMELSDLPTLDEVLNDPKNSVIPADLSLRHKYISVLVIEAGEDCDKAEKLVPYLTRYPAEVARFALDNLVMSCPKVANTQAYIQWEKRLK